MRAPAVDVRGVLAFRQLANSCLFRVGRKVLAMAHVQPQQPQAATM